MIKPSHVKADMTNNAFSLVCVYGFALIFETVSNSTKYHPKLAFDQYCDR